MSGLFRRIGNNHSIAIKAPAQKLVSRSPKVQSETPVVEFSELFYHRFTVPVEIRCPLLKREKVADAIIEHLLHTERRFRHLVEKIVKNEERMVAPVNIFDHER